MKQTVNFYQFENQFNAMRPDNFSYHGLKALFEYIEDFEEDTGEEIEFDVIGLCCEFSEYGSPEDAACCSGFEYGLFEDEPDDDALREWLRHRTTLIEFGAGVIIQDF